MLTVEPLGLLTAKQFFLLAGGGIHLLGFCLLQNSLFCLLQLFVLLTVEPLVLLSAKWLVLLTTKRFILLWLQAEMAERRGEGRKTGRLYRTRGE